MARLRRSSPDDRGWTRRRAGKGFVYLDEHGARLPEDDAQRARDLVIPPAWTDVWICRWPNGHLQAVGTDVAGRRQYLYHPDWRTQRDAAKHARVLDFGRVLSKAREQVLVDLGTEGMSQDRACAVAVRLLDLGYFRIGNDVYAEANGSFGLTTLQRQHVRKQGDTMVFCFVGKSGIEHCITIEDAPTVQALEVMRKRRGPADEELLAWKKGRAWKDLDSAQVNDYIRRTTGIEATAKDFRTWHATVIAAASLAESDEPGDTRASRKRAEVAAMKEVAEYLGNTPALARASYVDPRVVDAFDEGITIKAATRRKAATPDERQSILERAVLKLLREA
jgi:DNA topoisomerase I